MYEITFPYRLIIPSLISICILTVLLYYRKKLLKKRENKLFWISLIVFFSIYLFILGGGIYSDISSQLTLRKFDLNGNGMFNGSEITPELKAELKKAISDTGRNFAPITGLFFSGIIALFVFIVGKKLNK